MNKSVHLLRNSWYISVCRG